MPTRSAADYRKEAGRCRALAKASMVAAVRQTLLDVATTFETLARQIDELEKAGYRMPADAE